MTRKKSSARVMNSENVTNDTENAFEYDVSSPNISTNKKMAAKARHISLQALASFLDRDRNTISKWIDNGLPYVEKADRDLGKAWVFDSADVVRWLEKRAADITAEKLGDTGLDGKTSTEEAKRRRAVADAIVSEIEAAEAIKTVVRVSHIVDKIANDYAELRGRMSSIPDAIAGRVEASLSLKVREIADDQIRIALKSLRTDKEIKE